MTRHRRVEVGTWHDRQFCELSPPPPCGQFLWLYLLCGRRTTVFPGLVVASEPVITHDLRWPAEGLRAAWAEVETRRMAIADWSVGLILLPKALMVRGVPRETSRPGSPNTFGGWSKAWTDIPECRLRDWYLAELGRFACALDELVLAERGKPPKQTYYDTYLNAFAASLSHGGRTAEDSLSALHETYARARMPAGDARAPVPVPDPDPVLFDQDPSGIGSPTKGSGGGGDLRRSPFDPDNALERRVLRDAFLERVNRARSDLSIELGLGAVRPIALMGEGERALMARLRESADPAADMDHVITVAVSEARSSRELRWLGWSLAEPKAWRTKLATTTVEAHRGRRGDSVFGAIDRAAADLRDRPLIDVDPEPEDSHDR